MSNNWVVENLENALETWNSKLSEIWRLLSESPTEFKGGWICTLGAVLPYGYYASVQFLPRDKTSRASIETVYPFCACKGGGHLGS